MLVNDHDFDILRRGSGDLEIPVYISACVLYYFGTVSKYLLCL